MDTLIRLSRIWIWIFVFSPLLTWGQGERMNTQEINNFHQKLDDSMGKLTSLTADFTQVKHISFMKDPIKSKGRFNYIQPSKIRWEYTEPTRQVLNFDQNMIRIESENGEQNIDLKKNRMYQQLSELMTSTMEGSKLFDPNNSIVTYFRASTNYLVIMKPKDKKAARFIQQIEMEFDGATFLVRRIKITEASEDYTDLQFHNQVKNNSISLR